MLIRLENQKSYEITSIGVDQIADKPFYEIYSKAFSCLGRIVDANDDIAEENEKKNENGNIGFFYDVMEINNLIAFTGDRGTGKTTSMLNFVNFTRSKENLPKAVERLDLKDTSICSKRFYSLPVIDPSKLSEDESLIGVIIARIYEQIREKASKLDNPDSLRKAIAACEEAYQAIRVKHQTISESFKTNPDDLEHLSMLANTTKLRTCLNILVDEYLKICIKTDGERHDASAKNAFLIIPIDDLDTNIKIGYTIAEEIRSFLLIPKVVLPIAVKLEQMADLIEQKFITEFGAIIKQRHLLDADPAEMAVKYMEKLVPMQRRIGMPIFHVQNVSKLQVTTQKEPAIKDGKPHNIDGVNFVQYFLDLVNKTTGILLTKNEYGSHPLLPLNLRAIRQLLDLFEGMKEITVNFKMASDERQQLIQNLDKVEAWLLDSVCSNSVPRGMANIVRKVSSHPDELLNAFLVRQLDDYGIKQNIRATDREGKVSYCGLFGSSREVSNILKPETHPENISLGDVLFLLERMQEVNSGEGIRHFVAAIKMLYSIKITRLLYVGDPQYEKVRSLMGGLVHHPSYTLTASGLEHMKSVDTTGASVKIDDTKYWLDGAKPVAASSVDAPVDASFAPMTLAQATWLSFFVVAYSGRPLNDLHDFKGGAYYTSRYPYKVKDDTYPFVTLNWLGFMTAALDPRTAIERLLWLFAKQSGVTDAATLEESIADYKTKTDDHVNLFRLNSVDVVNDLICDIHSNRYKIGNKDPNDIDKLRGFFNLRDSLKASLETILGKTAIASEVEITNSPFMDFAGTNVDVTNNGFEWFALD